MERHLVMTKMCLNNWHYINEKILHFHKDINFFTGHSGSGKSTVLDALQIVLYADSNGRGFFNKAAKEDSDRTLIEYLRGMKVVSENNKAAYLRNNNFSTTIVLEFQNSETLMYQCVGIVFDVDVASNDYNRLFFWHKGEFPANGYRINGKTMSIKELKEYLKDNYERTEYEFNTTNEKFRAKLYHEYFGGLNEKTFPALFKRAIPFKMNMKLEEFVKEYIATERDIHIEDMQDSVMQYVRLRRRLEDTKHEISLLEENNRQYDIYRKNIRGGMNRSYCLDKLELDGKKHKRVFLETQKTVFAKEAEELKKKIQAEEAELLKLQKERDSVLLAMENSDVEHLKKQLEANQELYCILEKTKKQYDKMAAGLTNWKQIADFPEEGLNAVLKIQSYTADTDDFTKLKSITAKYQVAFLREKDKLVLEKQRVKEEMDALNSEMSSLKKGKKVYPAYLAEARDLLKAALKEKHGKSIDVRFVADTIEVTEPEWQNAVEGYMGGNKLSLVTAPEYVQDAMEIYETLDKQKYSKVSILDTMRVMSREQKAKENSLAAVVKADSDYMTAYVNYLLGNVICCVDVKELRNCECGVTKDCLLYKGYKLKHMEPKNYRELAFIGQNSVEARLAQLREQVKEALVRVMPVTNKLQEVQEKLSYEYLTDDISIYEENLQSVISLAEKKQQMEEMEEKLRSLEQKTQVQWQEKRNDIEKRLKAKRQEKEQDATLLHDRERALISFENELSTLEQEIRIEEQAIVVDEEKEAVYAELTQGITLENMDKLRARFFREKTAFEKKAEEEYHKLLEIRQNYQKEYGYRGFSVVSRENNAYDQLLETLQSDKLNEYMEKAKEQGKTAIYHFKTDFIYKIRDAIKEVLQQKDDLNRILAGMDFGKDRYRFVISKSQGSEGRFYDMFMDQNLEINPQALSDNMENQMDLFSMEHENHYQELIHELLDLFMPPEDCDQETVEEARRNMERYADYRTYLSFDMEQIIEGMPPMRLSKMLTKNSGGEGQNPLYVALLASFAQVYQAGGRTSIKNRATPRLVVLDEAFSKMDAQKVESCIRLMRNLGFQAIISATNDKIQNYVENVDKTFVFANPNKNHISIQEFEQKELKAV